MNLDRVSSGDNIPDEINVIIEIPAHSDPVKYEVDKDTGAMFVDRFMSSAMFYLPRFFVIRLSMLNYFSPILPPASLAKLIIAGERRAFTKILAIFLLQWRQWFLVQLF